MKKTVCFFLAACLCIAITPQLINAQTSWKGTTSTNWTTASNWTAGVPTSTVDAVIGDASFTGANQPTVNSASSCKSLTVGGTVSSVLTLSRNLTVSGGIIINSNGTIAHAKATLSLTGNWTNNGTYSATNNNSKINFAGVAQSFNGGSVTTFRKPTINAGSTVTMNTSFTVSGAGSVLTVNGTINPGISTTYLVTASSIVVNGGKLLVYASTFAGNYSVNPTLNAGSIVEYASSAINQTVSNSITYTTLSISGTTTKTLAGNLPVLNSSSVSEGNIFVNGGILNLSTFSANRGTTVTGGVFRVYNDATLRIAGTNGIPANYASRILQLTSTVQYAGTNQTVLAETYGNLQFSSSSGAVIKTMPAIAFTVQGNFSSSIGTGTSVSYTAASDITVNGNFSIGSGTTFNGSSFSHSLNGNWINDGVFTGSTSSITMTGVNAVISGAGIFNFYNLSLAASGITATSTSLTVSGNLFTAGPGQFTHSSGGTLTMSGAAKIVSGSGITLFNLTISGSVTTTSSINITGNLAVSGSFSASSGIITMSGGSKSFSGAGSIAFYNFSATGSITTAVSFSIASSLDVSGSFSATAGVATFTGTSSLNGAANLYNVTLNGTSLRLASNAVLGIANVFTISSGSLDVTSSFPNTVNYNGSIAQTIIGTAYNNLILSNGNTKTAGTAIVVNRDLTISATTTFNASSYTHQVKNNWNNNGTFAASSGTISFTGITDGTITGATTFNILTINKTSSTNTVALANNVSATTVNVTSGSIHTGSNTITITATRTGNGIILGNIQRTHAFVTGTAYAFEGPDNTVIFSGVNTVSSILVSVTTGGVSDFPFNGSINRVYNISITGIYITAALRLHYEDAELNGNTESGMQLWKYNGFSWMASGKTSNSTGSNYVEQTGLTGIASRWTCSENQNVIRWNGNVSSDWNTAANWTTVQGSPSKPPGSADIVQIGTAAFANQPIISSSASAKNIILGSTQAVTLSLATGGSLTVSGNVSGTWSNNTAHTINVNNQVLTVNGDMVLSDGVTNHIINLNVGGGTLAIAGSLVESGGAAVTVTGAGALNIGGDFNYTSGTFTAGSSTVVYNGAASQIIAPVIYNHVTINKIAGIASLNGVTTIGGNLMVSAGELINFTTTTINGNTTVATGSTFKNYLTLHSKGNWTINGTYTVSGDGIYFDGTGDQYISASSFNNVTINKISGKAILTGNVIVNGNLTIIAGTLDVQTYSCDRSIPGGYISIADGANLLIGGANNFPSNYDLYNLSNASSVAYYGATVQTVKGITYGNLIFSNGGSNAKTLSGSAVVNGDIAINNGASLGSDGFTISLYGNWTSYGTFIPSAGTVILQGLSKTITGNTTFNKLTVNGSYTVAGSDITYNGLLNVTTTGTYAAGSGIATVNGDLTNSGSLSSSGTTTFTGTVVQTLRLLNALTSTSTGVINFNGTVSPILNSTSSPSFAILNISNTGGINPSTPWQVFTAMNVNSGGIFNGGVANHYIYGNFSNAGTVTSTGKLFFTGTADKTIDFGSSGFTSNGQVAFSGSGLITINGTPGVLKDVTISNTHAAGVTPSSNWNMAGNFVINSNAIFNASSYSHTTGGNIESNGTLNGGTSSFTMTSVTGELTGSDNTVFNHFTITGAVTSLSDFKVAGNYTNNGIYDGALAAMIMTGSNAASIGGSTTPTSLSQLIVAKSGGAIVTMNTNLSDVSLLYIQSGVLFTAAYSLTQDAAGGFLLIDNAATLRLGGINSLPGFSGYGLDANSNIDYAGTTQSIGNAAIYGNLLITAAGTKNAIVPFSTQGNFILTNGSFTSAISVTHSIGGNWLMSGGTFNNTNITVLMNGSANQDISSTGAFKNITINKSAGSVTLSSDVTVNATLNLTAGKILLGDYNLAIGNTGTISNANATNYIVATGNGTLNQQVVAGGNKIFPVGLLTSYTPATVGLTAGSVTDIIKVRMLTAAYNNGSSGTPATGNAVNTTWMIAETVTGGSNASVSLQWPLSLELPGFNRALSRLSHYTAGAWEYGISNTPATGSNPYTVTRSGFTDFSPFAVTTFMALPVTWLNINGRKDNNNNIINWAVASEENNDHFSIEVSTMGNYFIEIGKIRGAGTTNVEQRYSFTHYNVTQPVYYYRIKQVDIDGKFSYSKIVRILADKVIKNGVTVLNNPIQDKLAVSIMASRSLTGRINITDVAGRIVYRQSLNLNTGNNIIDIGNFNYAAGIYYIVFLSESGDKEIVNFIKK